MAALLPIRWVRRDHGVHRILVVLAAHADVTDSGVLHALIET
jgi:hypothetical protein